MRLFCAPKRRNRLRVHIPKEECAAHLTMDVFYGRIDILPFASAMLEKAEFLPSWLGLIRRPDIGGNIIPLIGD